jgi:RNA polymerase sigma-70 factor (ECF subfamily)
MKDNNLLLIKECQIGDISAFEKLVNLYKKQIYLLAYQITGNHEDADDISQETFIHAYKAISKFKGESTFSTWLHRITINLSINHLKSESRQVCKTSELEILDTKLYSIVSSCMDDPSETVETNELIQQIKEAMKSLPVEEKVVFILRVNQDLSYKEMAKTLNCPIGTIMSRLNRARKRLRNKLKDYVI